MLGGGLSFAGESVGAVGGAPPEDTAAPEDETAAIESTESAGVAENTEPTEPAAAEPNGALGENYGDGDAAPEALFLNPLGDGDGTDATKATVTFDLSGMPGPFYYDNLNYPYEMFIELSAPVPTEYTQGASYGNYTLPFLHDTNYNGIAAYTLAEGHRYTFLGWSTTGDVADIVKASTLVGNEATYTLFAVWEDAGAGARVTLVSPSGHYYWGAPCGDLWINGTTYADLFNYSYNGTTGPITLGSTWNPMDPSSPAYYTPAYTFKGWYPSLSAAAPITAGDTISSTTLYPRFEANRSNGNTYYGNPSGKSYFGILELLNPNKPTVEAGTNVNSSEFVALVDRATGQTVPQAGYTCSDGYNPANPGTLLQLNKEYWKTQNPGAYSFDLVYTDCVFENVELVVSNIKLIRQFAPWDGVSPLTAELGISQADFSQKLERLELNAYSGATPVSPLILENLTLGSKDGNVTVSVSAEFIRENCSLDGTCGYTARFVFSDGQVVESIFSASTESLAGFKIVKRFGFWDGESDLVARLNIDQTSFEAKNPQFELGTAYYSGPGGSVTYELEPVTAPHLIIGSDENGLTTLTLSAEYLKTFAQGLTGASYAGPHAITSPETTPTFSFVFFVSTGEHRLEIDFHLPLDALTGYEVLTCFTPWDGTSDLSAEFGISRDGFEAILDNLYLKSTYGYGTVVDSAIALTTDDWILSEGASGDTTVITLKREFLQRLYDSGQTTTLTKYLLGIDLKDERPSIQLEVDLTSISTPVTVTFDMNAEGPYYAMFPSAEVDALEPRTFWSGRAFGGANALPSSYYLIKDGRICNLLGWSLEENGSSRIGQSYPAETVGTTDFTLYAVWEETGSTVPVTLVLPQDGPRFNFEYLNEHPSWRTFTEYPGQNYSSIYDYSMLGWSDEALTLSLPGYTFEGWYLSPDATEPITRDSIVMDSAHNLYGRLVPNANNANGNFGSYDNTDTEAELPSIHVDAPYGNFERLVNTTTNEVVDPSSYTLREGSTEIELSKDYLESLGTGDYAFRMVYTDFSIDSIQAQVTMSEIPLNGDATLASLGLNVDTPSGAAVALSPSFAPATYSYTATVENTVSTINITAITNSSINGENTTAVTGSTGTQTLSVGQNTFTVNTKAEDGTELAYTITVTREAAPLSSSKDITSFKIGDAVGIISTTAAWVAITVPAGTDVTALAPTVEHTGIDLSPASGVAQDFTAPVTYTVKAEDGSTKDYTVTVSVTPPKTTNSITSFSLAGANGLFLGSAIYVTVPAATVLTNLEPVITHNGVSINLTGSRDFSAPVTYAVTAEDGSSKTYRVFVSVAANPEDPEHEEKPAIDASDFGSSDGTGDVVSIVTEDLLEDESNFEGLYLIVGNELRLVARENYTLERGSTKITLQEGYLQSLGNGHYTFAAVYTNGLMATMDLTIALPAADNPSAGGAAQGAAGTGTGTGATDSSIPATSDNPFMLLVTVLLLLGGASLTTLAVLRKTAARAPRTK